MRCKSIPLLGDVSNPSVPILEQVSEWSQLPYFIIKVSKFPKLPLIPMNLGENGKLLKCKPKQMKQPSLTRTYSLSNLIGKRIRLNPSSPDPHLFDWKWAIKRPATNHFEEKITLFRKRLIGTRSIPIERNWLLQRQRRKNGLVRKANRITVRTKSWLVPAGIHSNTIDKDPRWRKQGRLLAWFLSKKNQALSYYKEVDRSASLLSELERLGWEVTIRWESYVVLFPLRRPARSSPDVELLPSS